MTDGSWRTVADGVLVRRYSELDLSVGLVLGEHSCLVIDTRGDEVQGAELAAAVREVTGLPWTVLYTHAHFDHVFGAAAFQPCEVWAHERCRERLGAEAELDREHWAGHYRAEGEPAVAEAIEQARIVPPEHLVTDRARIDLGGRYVELVHPGRGHTDHDLVAWVPDAGVLFSGDLVEHGGAPQFGEAYPRDWPAALDAVLALDADVVVPGHGDPATPEFVATQRDEIALLAELCRGVHAGELTEPAALARSPYPETIMRQALARPQ